MPLYSLRSRLKFVVPFAFTALPCLLKAQQSSLLLSEAIKLGVNNYQSIKAKQNYYKASEALVQNARNEYLPNVIGSLQQDFGTINGQFGPLTPYGSMGVSSSGPNYSSQSWHAAFGSAYILNSNWEVYTFGRVTSKINLFKSQAQRDSFDISQEQFVHAIRITGAYLNLLTAQRFIRTAQSNVDRVKYVQQAVLARTRSGLNAGVDSSIVNAEVSSAKLSLITAVDNEQQSRNRLAQLLNIAPGEMMLDTLFFHTVPERIGGNDVSGNPQVKYFQSRIDYSQRYETYLKKSILPGVNLFGVFQTRGSGFKYNYSPAENSGYSKSYLEGITPKRFNYATGVSLAWNFLSPKKISEQVQSQRFITQALQDEYGLISTQLKDQLILADQRIENSLQSYREVPLQYKAASDAYRQKGVLYKNGLTNIIDLQQALYLLNRAETDLNIVYINVWQSFLQKVAASGDLNLLLSQVR